MKILLTNDDGWGAPGLVALEKVAAEFGEIWTVAPRDHMSGISHVITFERPMELVEKSSQSFALDGTPADCTRIGMTQLGVEFDLVLAGVNNGANLGADTFVSGTVAGAREAWLGGLPALALSQRREHMSGEFDWGKTESMTRGVLKKLLEEFDKIKRGLWNINLPDTKQPTEEVEMVKCELDPNSLPVVYKTDDQGRYVYSGVYSERARVEGCDISLCFDGAITISRIK